MAEPADRVQLGKWESTALGGDGSEEAPFIVPIDPLEDAIEVGGIYGQNSGDTRDESCLIYRDNDEWLAKDGTDTTAFAFLRHKARHILSGADEIDGDQLGIGWNPTNYTPATTPSEVTSVDHLTAHLYGIDQALGSGGGSGGGSSSIYVPWGNRDNGYNSYGVEAVSNTSSSHTNFRVPSDAGTVSAVKLCFIPAITSATANIDLDAIYAAVGESFVTHSENDTTSTYSITVNQPHAIDIQSKVFNSIAAGDFCGLKITNNIGTWMYMLGVEVTW